MTIAIGCDHAGVQLKNKIVLLLKDVQLVDFGANNNNSVDYPDFGSKVAKLVSDGKADKGILICGTGIGMSIVANKFANIRAALCHDEFTAKMCRLHNDANILVLGARIVSAEMAEGILNQWLNTGFEGGRHSNRLNKITQIEESCGYNK